MKKLLLLISFALVAAAFVGCSVDFDVTGTNEDSNQFSCTDDDDCLSQFKCSSGGICVSRSGGGPKTCVDDDDDGYGSNEDSAERADCRNCQEKGDCSLDCDDDNAAVFPGGAEECDGFDNDCDDTTEDGVQVCADSTECPPGGDGYLYSCNQVTNLCEAKMVISICTGEPGCGCNNDPLTCTDGMIEEVPEQCK